MIIIFILVFIAGIAKAIVDTLQFHYKESVFYSANDNFYNAEMSWKNKYSDINNLIRKKWFGLIPIPVFLTDGWHLFQAILLSCIFASIVLYVPITQYKILDFLILRSIFGLSFTIFYDKTLIK